jgi:TrmH family RNA methyltransferase
VGVLPVSPRPPLHISSLGNPRVKEAAALRDRKGRERTRLALVEGARELGRAIEGGWRVDALFVCEPLLSPEARALWERVDPERGGCTVTPAVFDKLALREGSDGIVAVVHERVWSLAEALAAPVGGPPLVVALHGVEKPGNLGAVLRTADGVGASGVVALEGTGDHTSPNAIRSSLGAAFTLPLARASSEALVDACRERGIALYAAALTTGSKAPWELELARPACLVLGAEAAGLPSSWLSRADACVAIPMRGSVDSFNVSVAAAMLLYEAMRRRLT